MAPPPQSSNTLKIVLIIVGILFVVGLLICGVLAALLIPAVSAARTAAQRMQSQNNVKMIMLGLHNYHATYNQLPAAYTTDAEGKPLLSWRVAILPFVEGMAQYEQVDFTKPWDAPENAQLLQQMPSVYRSPLSDPSLPPDCTTVFAIRSDKSVLQPPAEKTGQGIGFSQMMDGTANTVAIVEIPTHGIPWTKPDDLTPQQAYDLYTNSKHPEQCILGMADGAVKSMGTGLSRETFEAIATINGGEAVTLP